MLTSFVLVSELLKTICVGNLVQRPESRGNGTFVTKVTGKRYDNAKPLRLHYTGINTRGFVPYPSFLK